MTSAATAMAVATLLCLSATAPAAAQALDVDLGEAVDSLSSAASDIGEKVDATIDGAVGDVLGDGEGSGDILELFDDATERRAIQPLGQDRVLDAVRTQRAMPLADMLDLASLATDDEVIDARLVEVRGFLLYEIKVFGEQGDVRQLYFYARSGLPVR